MATHEGEPDFSWRRPWRSAVAGWTVAGVVLLAGVPLFLCMPPWNDVTLHDMAARSILRGGVHYRDVFDTNLPGIDWAMAGVRAAFGWSYEVLRAVDLVVFAGIVAVLCRWLRRCGGTGYAVAWFVVAAALWYPFTSEFNHVQRDPWMLLPAVAAAWLRLKQVGRAGTGRPLFGPAVLEGLVWGAAVWVKPHVVIPALAVWAVSAVLMLRYELRRRVGADFAGLLLGGLLAGAPGVAWLVATGAWPEFLDIFLNWNPDYLSDVESVGSRFDRSFACFRPWSVLHLAALPLAALALWEARVWSRRSGEPAQVNAPGWLYLPATSDSVAAARALLAAMYLAWFAQTVLVQKAFDYVQVPLLLLGMAVVAFHRWCFAVPYLLWFVAVGVLVNAAEANPAVASAVRAVDPASRYGKFEKHSLADWEIVKLWPRCWQEGGSPELRDKLGQYTDIHCGTKWGELNDVAQFLRSVEPPLGPGELNCWHDGTHPLYLKLDLDPATRYMHYGTAFGIKSKRARIAGEVAASRQRYVVSDLVRTTWEKKAVYDPASWQAGDPLPRWLPVNERAKFPWNQPVVFRSGRYVVHKVTQPLGTIRVPDWGDLGYLDQLGPDE
jgi:hypothetical protein